MLVATRYATEIRSSSNNEAQAILKLGLLFLGNVKWKQDIFIILKINTFLIFLILV